MNDFPCPIETAHDNVQALELLRATFLLICNQASVVLKCDPRPGVQNGNPMVLAKFLKNKNSQRIVALLLLQHNARFFLPRYYALYAGILWTNLVLSHKGQQVNVIDVSCLNTYTPKLLVQYLRSSRILINLWSYS